MIIFWLCLLKAEGVREHAGVSPIKALIPFMKVLPSWPNHFLIPSQWGLGFQHRNLGERGDTDIQSITSSLSIQLSALQYYIPWTLTTLISSDSRLYLFNLGSPLGLIQFPSCATHGLETFKAISWGSRAHLVACLSEISFVVWIPVSWNCFVLFFFSPMYFVCLFGGFRWEGKYGPSYYIMVSSRNPFNW